MIFLALDKTSISTNGGFKNETQTEEEEENEINKETKQEISVGLMRLRKITTKV